MNSKQTPSTLNEWTDVDLKRSGFNAEGSRSNEALKVAGKSLLFPSPDFAGWLVETGGSLVFSSYDSDQIFLLGTDAANGYLFLDADGVVDGGEGADLNDTFIQDGIDNNCLKYAHDGGKATSDSFGFRLADAAEEDTCSVTNHTFTLQDAKLHCAAHMARLSKREGYRVLASFITPLNSQQAKAHGVCLNHHCMEAHLNISLEICLQRAPPKNTFMQKTTPVICH